MSPLTKCRQPWLQAALCVLLFSGWVGAQLPKVYTRWKHFTRMQGLPSNRVFCLAVQGDALWVGTEGGLARDVRGKWTVFTPQQGLVQQAVSSLAVDRQTGDVWIGTFGGLSQYTGGVFHNYTQFNSGLVNNVVYGVAVQGRYVWAATAAGVSRLDTWTHQWAVFTQENAPMPDPWAYGLAVMPRSVLVAMWGSGVLRYSLARHYWQDYANPNQSPELLLFRNQGLVNNVVSSVSYNRHTHVWWAGTYFGLSGYDGRHWHNYLAHHSGLVSNFINHVRSRGRGEWICTADGLNYFDPGADMWLTYRKHRGHGEILLSGAHAQRLGRMPTPPAMTHNYIFDVAFQQGRIWVATADGLSLGYRLRTFSNKEKTHEHPRTRTVTDHRLHRQEGNQRAAKPE